MTSTIKLNYDHKALASVVNCDRKCDATIWSVPYDHNLQLYNFYSTGHSQIVKCNSTLCLIPMKAYRGQL